jgi:phosphoglucosamine mutase
MTIEELGFEVTRTKVGDAFVSEELKKSGDFGGEPSGCWIFPQVSYCPDGIYAAAQVAQIASRGKLSQLAEELPSYPILRGSLPLKMNIKDVEQRLMSLEPASVSTVDGIRLNFNDGWLLVRASGTEPKIRVTAEAKSKERAKEIYDAALGAL